MRKGREIWRRRGGGTVGRGAVEPSLEAANEGGRAERRGGEEEEQEGEEVHLEGGHDQGGEATNEMKQTEGEEPLPSLSFSLSSSSLPFPFPLQAVPTFLPRPPMAEKA